MKTYENGKLIGIIETIFPLVAVFEFNYINKKNLEQLDLEVI